MCYLHERPTVSLALYVILSPLSVLFSLVPASSLSPRFGPKSNSKMPFNHYFHHPPPTHHPHQTFERVLSLVGCSYLMCGPIKDTELTSHPTQPLHTQHTILNPIPPGLEGGGGAKSCLGSRPSMRISFYLKPMI